MMLKFNCKIKTNNYKNRNYKSIFSKMKQKDLKTNSKIINNMRKKFQKLNTVVNSFK